MWLITFILSLAFIFGLVQWAKCGASILESKDLRDMQKSYDQLRHKTRDEEEEYLKIKSKLRATENRADTLLKSSFRIIGVLVVVMWVLIGGILILNALGVDMNWSSVRSSSKTWEQKAGSKGRNNLIRGIGESFK